MDKKEAIYKAIKDNKDWKKMVVDEKGKVTLNGKAMLGFEYEEIREAGQKILEHDNVENRIKNGKTILKGEAKDLIVMYARENAERIREKQESNKPAKTDWYSKLQFDDKDKPVKTLNNVMTFIELYPLYKGKLYFNEFTQYEEYDGELIRDYMVPAFRKECEMQLGYESKDKIESALQYVCHKNSINPFKEAIEKLTWDGEERAATFFIKFIGAEDTKLNKSMTTKFLYATMKRLYEPGCDFDNMLIAYDEKQGTGKSKIIERLVGSLGLSYGVCTSLTCDNKDKDNVDKMNKTWIVCIDELADFLKKEPEQTKQFLSQTSDQARLSYAKRSEVYKRHCVFYATSNIEFFLKDYTSGYERRYWILECHGEVHDAKWWEENLTDEYCKQVIAEMKYMYDTEPQFNYKTLDIEEMKELQRVQLRHKTFNNDELLIEDLKQALNAKIYTDEPILSYEKWIDAIKYGKPISYKEDDLFKGEHEGRMLDRLPRKWVKKYAKEELKRDISTQYLNALIGDDWETCVYRLNDKSINGYVRKKQLT